MLNLRCLGLGLALLILTIDLSASVQAGPGLFQPFDPLGGASPALPLVAVTRYTLQPGDTISNLAKEKGLTVDTVLSFNRIKSPRMLRAGVTLQIPNRDGILLSLDAAQSVATLSDHFQVFPPLILEANALPRGTTEVKGTVFVPGAQLDAEEHRQYLGELFAWPTVGGRISSYFGRRNDPFTGAITHHSGVDIANYYGAPVLAAGSGVVTYTGYDSILGNHIQVDQGRGYLVVYGHLSAILTKPGRRVIAGQLLGRVGSTGYSTGPHLHFSAYYHHRLLNPMTLFG